MYHTRAFIILMLVATSVAGILAADDKGRGPAEGARTTDKSESPFSFPFPLWPENKEGHVVRSFGVGSASTELLPQYVKALRSKKVGDITLALTCLGCLGQHAESVIPAVLPTLEHPSLKVRVEAIECCGRIGSSDPEMLAKMLEKVKPTLASDDKQLKLAAIFCVSRLETPKYEHYREALRIWSADNDEETTLTARNAVRYSAHIWFRFLVADALLSADPTVRTTALRLLEGMRSPAQRAITSAVSWRLLSDGNPHVRAGAAYCLARNSILPELEMRALSALRRSSSSDIVRCSAVRGMLLYENQLPQIVYREVALALADDSQDVRDQAAMISNFISRNRSVMGHQLSEPLVSLLADQRPEVRRQALTLLGWCKSAAREAVPSIAYSMLVNGDWDVKISALHALLEIVLDN
jgi:HEAT repeat protein